VQPKRKTELPKVVTADEQIDGAMWASACSTFCARSANGAWA
jgi:hypothetical protein